MAALSLGKKPSALFTGGWVSLGSGMVGCIKSRPTGIPSPDRAAHAESIYPDYDIADHIKIIAGSLIMKM
jgi:hypothetical protein